MRRLFFRRRVFLRLRARRLAAASGESSTTEPANKNTAIINICSDFRIDLLPTSLFVTSAGPLVFQPAFRSPEILSAACPSAPFRPPPFRPPARVPPACTSARSISIHPTQGHPKLAAMLNQGTAHPRVSVAQFEAQSPAMLFFTQPRVDLYTVGGHPARALPAVIIDR